MTTSFNTKTLIAGTLGGFVWTIVSFLTFGFIGRYTIFNPELQSPKFMDVFISYEPRAIAVDYPWFYLIGFIFFGIGHAYLYQHLYPVLGVSKNKRMLRMTTLILFMSSLYFEIFGPLNLLSEPIYLIGLEMIFWACSILAEVWIIQLILEKNE